MKDEQWKKVLSEINEEEGLSKDNVIEKIKEKLKAENEDEYKKWEKAGFSVNHLFKVKDEKFTLLYLAANYNLGNVVKALLEAEKIDVNAKKDNHKCTLLHYAVSKGNTELVNVLLKAKGIDVNVVDEDGWTPLHYAVSKGHTEIEDALKEKGAGPLEEAEKNSFLNNKQLQKVFLLSVQQHY